MNNKAKGWAIDPATRTITAQTHTWDTAKAWVDCDLLECVRLDGGELWVDEEGMMRESKTVWVLNGRQMIAGRAFLVGGEWTDHDGRGLPEVCWLRDGRQVEAPRARAYPMTAEGMTRMRMDAIEEEGQAELAAVGSARADWPEGAQRPPTLGDFVTTRSGLTGMVVAVGSGWVDVRYIDGSVTQVPTVCVEVVCVD